MGVDLRSYILLPHFLTNIKQTNVKIFSSLDNPVLIIVNNWDLKGDLINLNHKKYVSIVVPMMFNLSWKRFNARFSYVANIPYHKWKTRQFWGWAIILHVIALSKATIGDFYDLWETGLRPIYMVWYLAYNSFQIHWFMNYCLKLNTIVQKNHILQIAPIWKSFVVLKEVKKKWLWAIGQQYI